MGSPTTTQPRDSVRVTIGIIVTVTGGLSLGVSSCLVLDPWIGTRPFWPGLNMPPGGEVAESAQQEFARLAMLIVAGDFLLAILLLVIGTGLLNRWRYLLVPSIIWMIAKAMLIACRPVLTWRIVDRQTAALSNKSDLLAVTSTAELGTWMFTILRAFVLVAVAVIIIVALRRRGDQSQQTPTAHSRNTS